MPTEPSCACCGTPRRVYNIEGHDQECIWYEEELRQLLVKLFDRDAVKQESLIPVAPRPVSKCVCT